MKMKIVYIILISIFFFSGCVSNDSLKFKNEYQNVSNTTVSIRYLNSDLFKRTINKTALIYIGSSNDLNCRNLVPVIFEMAESADLKTIYYYDLNTIDEITKNEIVTLINKKEITIPMLIFIKDGKLIDYMSLTTDYDKLTESEIEELKNDIYNNLNNLIAEKCTEETEC